MTAVAEPASRRDTLITRLLAATVFAYGALLAVIGLTLILDPFVHYDDVPALLAEPQGFYSKTLSEGRWINYWWHLRGFVTPASLNFQVYLLGWATYSAALALHGLSRSSGVIYSAILAALIAFSPQATLISGWFNTLIPGVWLIAAYAVIALVVSSQASRWLLFLFVPLALMTYSTYPFLLLAVCLIRQDFEKSLTDLVRLVALFIAAFAFGLAIIYALNFLEHGVFGVELAEWRDPVTLNATTTFDNLGKVWESLELTYLMMGFGQPGFALANTILFLGSLAVIARRAPLEPLYILAGIAIGLGLLSLHAFQNGIVFPFRSTVFVWVMFALALGRAAAGYGADGSPQGKLAWCLVVALVALSGNLVRGYFSSLSSWQTATATLANRVPASPNGIVFVGPTSSVIDQPDTNIMPKDLTFRLALLTGARTVSCEVSPQICTDMEMPGDLSAAALPPVVIAEGGRTFIALPPLPNTQP